LFTALFEEVAKIGETSVRRSYGDLPNTRLKGWVDVLARHAIIPQQQHAYLRDLTREAERGSFHLGRC
jgi:hypothetical protein